MSPTAQASSKKLTVDFTGVENRSGGPAAARVTAGDYLLEVVASDVKSKQSDPNSKYINWQLKIIDGVPGQRGTIYHITSLKPESLWSLRGFLGDLLGKLIPQSKVAIDLPSYIGKRIGATVDDDEPYTKQNADGSSKTTIKSRIMATFPASEFVSSNPAAATGASSKNGKVSSAVAADMIADGDGEDDEELGVEALDSVEDL